ncbi:MAG: hypothetical protein ACI8S6_005348 [Myxococcota bacterium]
MPEQLSFSRSLYRQDAIEATVAAYAQLATLTVDTSGEHSVVITVADPHPSLADELSDALCNHILFETIRRYRTEQGGTL